MKSGTRLRMRKRSRNLLFPFILHPFTLFTLTLNLRDLAPDRADKTARGVSDSSPVVLAKMFNNFQIDFKNASGMMGLCQS